MAFPTTSVLDDFNRADENPLSGGGNWALLNSLGAPLKSVSNQVGESTNALNESYWAASNFGPDCEVFCTFSVVPTAAGGMRLYVRIQGEGGASTWDGYSLRTSWVTGGANDTVTLNIITNNT